MHMADYSKIKWKELFAARILSRGYDYYLEGNVWNLHSKDGEISDKTVGYYDLQTKQSYHLLKKLPAFYQ